MKRAEDITEQKKAEEALKESEEKYKFLVDRMQEVAIILDKTGKILFANKFTLTILGYTEKELIGKSVLTFLTKDSIKKAVYTLTQEFLGKPQGAMEVEIKTKKGEIRTLYLSETSTPIYKDKQMTKLLVNGIDITERKKAEEALKESEEKYRAILDYSTDQIFIIDKNLKFISVNNFAAKVIGRKPEDIINKSLKEVFGQSDVGTRFVDNIKEVLRNKRSKSIEEEIAVQGKKNFISTQLNPIKDDSGTVVAVLGIARNITDRRKVEDKLKESQKILQSKVDELERFNKIVVGRELKMIELKEHIKKLEKNINKK